MGDVLGRLKNESGGHRVQRISPTEKRGRTHTSTVTVAILQELNTNIEIKDSDLRIEWYSGSGAGGQNRNKCQCCCRIHHIPTGVIATAQSRSRQNSLKEAMATISERVKGSYAARASSVYDLDRKNQMGSGMRGDKIRTYRVQDDIVKDHITNKSASCGKVLSGFFDLLW